MVRVNTSHLLLPTGIMGEEIVPEALFFSKICLKHALLVTHVHEDDFRIYPDILVRKM